MIEEEEEEGFFDHYSGNDRGGRERRERANLSSCGARRFAWLIDACLRCEEEERLYVQKRMKARKLRRPCAQVCGSSDIN